MASRQFNAKNAEAAVMALSQLAITRYGLRTLESLDVQQNVNRIDAEIHTKDLDLVPVSIVCLSAIQAIGTNANARFDEISAELELSKK